MPHPLLARQLWLSALQLDARTTTTSRVTAVQQLLPPCGSRAATASRGSGHKVSARQWCTLSASSPTLRSPALAASQPCTSATPSLQPHRTLTTSTLRCQRSASPPSHPDALPLFSHTLRRFYKLVHPDLFEQERSALRSTNSTSLQQLMSLMNDLKAATADTPFPPKHHYHLYFYIRIPADLNTHKLRSEEHRRRMQHTSNYIVNRPLNASIPKQHHLSTAIHQPKAQYTGWSLQHPLPEFYLASIVLATNGGDCRVEVGRAMSSMFLLGGLPGAFRWDSNMWQLKNQRAINTTDEEMDTDVDDLQTEDERWVEMLKRQAEIDARKQAKQQQQQ